MSDPDTSHRLELLVNSIESRLVFWRGIIIGAIAFLGLGTGAGLWTLYNRTLDQVQVEVANQALKKIADLEAQATTAAEKIRAALKDACHDPKWLDATGMCIFHLRPPGGGYAMNYGGAAALCAAHGARLCTLDQVRAAHAKGAEWCAASWVADLGEGIRSKGDPTYGRAGVLAFPTQGRRKGCGEGVNVFRDQNILTQNADAACCM